MTEPAGYRRGSGLISVLEIQHGSLELARTVSVPGEPMGAALTDGGRALVVANYLGGVDIFRTSSLESGAGRALVAKIGSRGQGDIEVALDGRYAFVPEELSADVAVYDLGGLGDDHARGVTAVKEVGAVPVEPVPAGVALAQGSGVLYVVSEGDGSEAHGELTAINVARAETYPDRGVIGAAPAGCVPVRIALSPDDGIAWVTDRGSDALLALRLNPASKAVGRLVGAVRVGPAPVDIELVDHGAVGLVTDSDRFSTSDVDQTVDVIDTADVLSGRAALIGHLGAGVFPRQLGRAGAGPVLFTDFGSLDVRLISATDLTWLGERQP